MNTKFLLEDVFAKRFAIAIFTFALVSNAHAGATALATQPFTSTNAVTALPNVMFVLDDSGSMDFDYLPDWAGPYKDYLGVTITTPTNRFFNSAYNGVAYNPATRYRPPVMYNSAGALDTTTYPSQTGQSAAQGGDVAATVGVPNWKAVKKDGYGIQATTTANLEGNAFFYTVLPGEHCTTAQLRSCTASSTPTGSYTFPAKLRWCTTSLKAADTTANSNGFCQASNIADTPTNATNGVTHYTFPRIAAPRNAVITVTGGGTVTAVTVDTLNILSASATGASDTDLAGAIVTQVNACTLKIPSVSSCAVVGYSATSSGNIVTLTAPGSTSSSPVVTGGATSVTAFSIGNVPGASLLTVITPSVSSYTYPGTATKSVNRTDCLGTTCTYAEEMTNYANWYAYYRTRMQMMKTSSSIAFSGVDEKFRVGYYSINNGTGSDFLNLSAFDATQKNLWYSKFFSATPFGATPLRLGLANTGRMYANKLSTLNGQSVTDPMQYSCQQNFSILSTDGYWNDTTTPTQVDGTTPIGQQDGSDPRPYYDGATYTRNASQTTRTDLQVGINIKLVEQKTLQQETSTRRLTESVVTTTTYPYKLETTQLQAQETLLDKSEYRLESRTYPLKADTRQLVESTFNIQSTTRPLQRYTYNLTETSTPLQAKVYRIQKTTYPLQTGTETVWSQISPLQTGTESVWSKVSPLQKKTDTVSSTSSPLRKTTTLINSSTYQLEKSTYKLRSSTRQLQQRKEFSTNGGDTWQDTGWVNVSSCTVAATGPAAYTRNTQCQYSTAVDVGGLSSCSTVAASTGPSYTVAQPVSCVYEAVPTVDLVTSCSVVNPSASSPYTPSVACAYASTPTTASGLSSCSANDQTAAATMTGNKVVCSYGAASAPVDVGTCTKTTVNSGALPKVECTYGPATPTVTVASCTNRDQSASTTMTGDKVVCGYSTGTWGAAASCSPVTPSPTYSANRVSCQYGVAGAQTTTASCTAFSQATTGAMSGDKVECGYNTISWANSATCNPVTPSPAYSASKLTCRYGTAAAKQTVSSCTAFSQATSSAMSGDKVACGYNGVTWANSGTCTPTTPSPAYSANRLTCRYSSTSSSNLSGQTSCTANSQPTTSAMTGDKVVCAWNTTPATTTNVASCTWNIPATVSVPKTECSYTGTATVTSNLATCTAVAPTGTAPPAPANGTVWSGPSKTCAYQAAVVASNLTTCSPTGAAGGPINYSSYSTCGYGAGAVNNNLSSCTVDAPEAGPSYSLGSTTACVYQASSTDANVTVCSPVAQSPTFAAPQKTCAYAAPVTSTVTTCSNVAVSGSAPYAGPAVSCSYDTTASTTNLNATTCSANRQTTSPYTGPAVDCTYSATPVVTNGLTSCSTVAQSAGPNYTGGAAVTCAYGAAGAWTNVTAGTCTEVAQSAGPSFSTARACAYNPPSVDTLTNNSCTSVAGSTGPVFSVLQKKVCVAGSFPVSSPAVINTVDTCSTAPTSVTDVGTGEIVDTATTCSYDAASVSDTPTCSPVAASGGSPYVTAVTCPVRNSGWVPVEPSCTATVPAATFDVDGKQVECRTTDSSPYTVAYPSGPVPVASCASGTNATTKVQTSCTTLLSTGPSFVETCTTVDPGAAPDYVKTTCNPTSSTSTSMGCVAQVATSQNNWQTVTCSYNAGTGTENTLADVAAYYNKVDLRTPALNNCVGAVVSPATVGSDLCSTTDPMNNVPTTAGDPNSAQHMTTFTLGLGASGYMKYSDTYTTDTAGDFPTVKGVSPFAPSDGIAADPTNGVCSWQAGGNCNWPFPSSNEQTTIDDLWHAGVNGRGAYFSATDPVSLSNSITSALAGVAAAGGAAAAPSLSTPSLTPADSYLFSSTFTTSDWTGEVVRRLIDPYNGIVSSVPDWAAQAKLDAKSARTIYAFDGTVATTKLKAFTSANYGTNAYFVSPHISTAPNGLTQFLCASVDTCLSSTDQTNAAGVNLINYLRGERTNEGALTDNTKFYRQRQHVLGDIVNAQLVYVTKPNNNYADAGYTAFVTAQSARQAVVYAGGNDGMLHAFAAKGSAATEALVDAAATANSESYLDPLNATLITNAAAATTAANAAIATDTTIGQELWAYIPSMVMPNLYKLADKKYKDKHRYFVDATPVVGDICVSDCSLAAAVWKTILVGGLGRGGRGYYALDITDPANPKALWEFTNANLGYSYGNPQIVKLANGSWVVLLTSGYNNIPNDDAASGDGVGRLFVLDAALGTQVSGIPVISTGVGSASAPSGLAKITAQVVNPVSDNTVEAVYGGDLLGNLWRFDVNNSIGATGYDAQLLATLSDGLGNAQPITTKPEVGLIQNQKVVFVGTGRYLAASDASDDRQQSLYAIKDTRAASANPAVAIFTNPGGSPRATGTSTAGFVGQVQTDTLCTSAISSSICTPGELVRTSTNNPVNYLSDNGWYVDLIGASERANTDPALGLGLLAFNTNAPSLLACDVGGKSYSYFLNYLTGGPIYAPGNGTAASNNGIASMLLANQFASAPTLVLTKSGKLIIVSGLSGGGTKVTQPPLGFQPSGTRRISWRELIRDN